jgi:hypothetical protein
MKEFAESVEFFHAVRPHLKRARAVVDLCSGHGFAGMLFAVFLRGACVRACVCVICLRGYVRRVLEEGACWCVRH